ncbi:MAG: NYN domain-containing protein [bacterium]
MSREEVNKILDEIKKTRERNMVIIDYGNVQKWEEELGWKIGIKELGNLIKYCSYGKKYLRRFYFGSDFGKNEKSSITTMWSAMILNKARMNSFEVVSKRVKYIHDKNYKAGFVKKCNFDIEMAVDMIKESKNYDIVILFSGDGDMNYVLEYLKSNFNKKIFLFGARGHIGRELYDGKFNKTIENTLYVEYFEYRLNMNRFKNH